MNIQVYHIAVQYFFEILLVKFDLVNQLIQVALADAQIHEFSHHLRDHFVMEAVSVARFLQNLLLETILARQKCYALRHNWLNDDHLIGRLLKPHMTGTIFINFAARHSLVKTKDSLVQQQFSVD